MTAINFRPSFNTETTQSCTLKLSFRYFPYSIITMSRIPLLPLVYHSLTFPRGYPQCLRADRKEFDSEGSLQSFQFFSLIQVCTCYGQGKQYSSCPNSMLPNKGILDPGELIINWDSNLLDSYSNQPDIQGVHKGRRYLGFSLFLLFGRSWIPTREKYEHLFIVE